MVRGQAEGLERVHVDAVVAERLDDLGRGVAETHALLDQALRDPEPGGDLGDAGAGVEKPGEGRDLVCRVHRQPDEVLGERDFLGRGVGRGNDAGDRVVGGDLALGGEFLEHGQAPAAGEDGETGVAVPGGIARAHDQVLEEAVIADGGLQLGLGILGRRRRADVLGRDEQMGKGYGLDDRGGSGCRHWALPCCLQEEASGATRGEPGPPQRLRNTPFP